MNTILEDREDEDMDDLPLFEHIEWSHLKKQPVSPAVTSQKEPEKSTTPAASGDEKSTVIRGEN